MPPEEYDWFDLHAASGARARPASAGPEETAHPTGSAESDAPAVNTFRETPPGDNLDPGERDAPQFFEFAGPLFAVRIQPASSITPVDGRRTFRALPRDRAGRAVSDPGIEFVWRIIEGGGQLDGGREQSAIFHAPAEPGLTRLEVVAQHGDVVCRAEAMITVTDTLLSAGPRAVGGNGRGIPGYTFERAPGELWRSRFDPARNVIVVNSGHRDLVFAARHKALKLRYLTRLFAKELVLRNFIGLPPDQLLELTLYSEENLK